MKSRNGFFLIFFIFLLVLNGCSSKPSIELISSSVEIRDSADGHGHVITSGERKGEVIKTIALHYDFVLKNTGNKTLGGNEKPNPVTFGYDDGIDITIEPNDKLKEVIKEEMGFNFFDKEERRMGKNGGSPILEPDEEAKYNIYYSLGAKEENPLIRLAPPQEQLDKLLENALKATLVIHIEDKEITRIDLSNPK